MAETAVEVPSRVGPDENHQVDATIHVVAWSAIGPESAAKAPEGAAAMSPSSAAATTHKDFGSADRM